MTATRTMLLAILAGVVAAVLTRAMLHMQRPHQVPAGGAHVAVAPELPPLPASAPAGLPAEPVRVESRPAATRPVPDVPVAARADRPLVPAPPPKTRANVQKPDFKLEAGQPIPEPIARAALAFVGTDADAEKVWTAAINDPNTPAKVRKNLIEDLNEDGFPDPKHVSPDDVPLIASRIKLIEEMAPDALDDDNAAAFAEAYKDLINMYAKASRQ